MSRLMNPAPFRFVALTLGLFFACKTQPAKAGDVALFQTWSTESLTNATSLRVWAPSDKASITLGVSTHPGKNEKRLRPTHSLSIAHTPRRVLHFELSDLHAGGHYLAQVYVDEKPVGTRRAFFTPRTDFPFRAIIGGDVGIYPDSEALVRRSAKLKPDIVMIGGDVAYADGNPSAYARWDKFLEFTEEAFAAQGRIAPLLVAIGNHEVQGYFESLTFDKAPFYRALFLPGGTDKPKSYTLKMIGENLAFYLLDTMHVVRHGGQQAAWLKQALKRTRAHRWKFAIYHIPLYPSVRDPRAIYSAEGRKHWAPLFDEFALTAAFENHDHGLKRTHRLKGGKRSPDGTLYLGDGTFGVRPRPVSKRPYLARASSRQHFWQVDVSKSTVTYRAIGREGAILDETTSKHETESRPRD